MPQPELRAECFGCGLASTLGPYPQPLNGQQVSIFPTVCMLFA
jgi:hypothetical protein